MCFCICCGCVILFCGSQWWTELFLSSALVWIVAMHTLILLSWRCVREAAQLSLHGELPCYLTPQMDDVSPFEPAIRTIVFFFQVHRLYAVCAHLCVWNVSERHHNRTFAHIRVPTPTLSRSLSLTHKHTRRTQRGSASFYEFYQAKVISVCTLCSYITPSRQHTDGGEKVQRSRSLPASQSFISSIALAHITAKLASFNTSRECGSICNTPCVVTATMAPSSKAKQQVWDLWKHGSCCLRYIIFIASQLVLMKLLHGNNCSRMR